MKNKVIFMFGPAPGAKGGISSVIEAYQNNGLFDQYPIRFIATFKNASAIIKIILHIKAFTILFFYLSCGKVSAIHLHTAARTSFFRKSTLAWLTFFFHIPVVIHIHSGHFIDFYENECRGWKKIYVRNTLARAYMVIVLTNSWKTIIGKILDSEKKIIILPNPIVKPAKIERTRQGHCVNFLFLGKICAEKGIYDLLNAIKLISDEGHDIYLRCGGDGDISQFNTEVSKLGISKHVKYLGWVSGAEKDFEYANTDVFILPSYFEGQPMTLLEAMASGLAIISTNVGGIPDTLMNQNEAILVEAGNLKELTNAIRLLIRQPEMRHSLAKRAKNRFDNENDAQKVNEKLSALYSVLLER